MAKNQNGNGTAFQQKVSDDELKKMVKSGLTGRDLLEKTGMKSYSLQNRLYALATRENDVSYLITFPAEVEYIAQRKFKADLLKHAAPIGLCLPINQHLEPF